MRRTAVLMGCLLLAALGCDHTRWNVTPKLVLLDAAGVVRGTYTGWGDHVPRDILAELQRWLVHEP